MACSAVRFARKQQIVIRTDEPTRRHCRHVREGLRFGEGSPGLPHGRRKWPGHSIQGIDGPTATTGRHEGLEGCMLPLAGFSF
uniref:Uncharacterized protein n=1 Tax=Oryza sativa subsp. japonica TaxID=39947 RepID=Q5Z6H4_ORYSJ|nr:hypothetical protein [Oryza sativa Japonica Group]BAD54445.1 hypothetical protein [Oryza sativa Japonica Group]